MRLLACVAIAIAFMDRAVFAQAPTNVPLAAATNPPPEADDKASSFAASAYTYFVPDDREYVQPTFTADRGWLHLGTLQLGSDMELHMDPKTEFQKTPVWYGPAATVNSIYKVRGKSVVLDSPRGRNA